MTSYISNYRTFHFLTYSNFQLSLARSNSCIFIFPLHLLPFDSLDYEISQHFFHRNSVKAESCFSTTKLFFSLDLQRQQKLWGRCLSNVGLCFHVEDHELYPQNQWIPLASICCFIAFESGLARESCFLSKQIVHESLFLWQNHCNVLQVLFLMLLPPIPFCSFFYIETSTANQLSWSDK